jgi:16S rRNA (uracil1498-N3)-methyltransferase
VERHDRSPVATFFSDARFISGENVALSESASHHVRVKRLAAGNRVQLTDGAGHRAAGVIASIDKRSVTIEVAEVEQVAPSRAIHLRVPVADRERMLWLAEKSVELGISSWQAVRFRRSASVTPRGEGDVFADKIRARMISALEQSGGGWLPNILADATVDALIAAEYQLPIVLDIEGDSLLDIVADRDHAAPTILIGPEGGLEPNERSQLLAAGWRRARLAPNVLRFETAGIAAVAAVRATDEPHGGDHGG